MVNKTVKTVLFVCTENACRSQMAEAIFNSMANSMAPEGWRAQSAGTKPAPVANARAATVLNEIGLELNSKPKLLTQDLVKNASRVVTMGCGDEGCPILPVKTTNWQLENPKGKPLTEFMRLRDVIFNSCRNLVRELA